MTTKTILEILQAYHTDGYQVEIDGAVLEWWEQSGDVIELGFSEPDKNIYMRANAKMIRDSEYGKMFHYSNNQNMRFQNWVAPVSVTQKINVEF